jgi:hypothetical protein
VPERDRWVDNPIPLVFPLHKSRRTWGADQGVRPTAFASVVQEKRVLLGCEPAGPTGYDCQPVGMSALRSWKGMKTGFGREHTSRWRAARYPTAGGGLTIRRRLTTRTTMAEARGRVAEFSRGHQKGRGTRASVVSTNQVDTSNRAIPAKIGVHPRFSGAPGEAWLI